MRDKKLTTWEAACIITGYGVGGGVLSMPYLANKIGFINSLVIVIIGLVGSYFLHIMIADLSMKTKGGCQIITGLNQFLFRGKYRNAIKISCFSLLLAVLLTSLTGYITGAEEIIIGLLPVSPLIAKLIFYIIAASIALFGLKILGVSENVGVSIIFVTISILAIASIIKGDEQVPLFKMNVNGMLAFYGMTMYALSAFFAVPQAVEGLHNDEQKIKKAIIIGFLNNVAIITIIDYCAIRSSETVTEVAMVGWAAGIGLWAQIIGGIFIIFAMLTTYWSLSFAMSDMVEETTKLGRRFSWLIATLPSLILALLNLGNFMDFMRMAGGFISLVISLMVVPAYIHSRNEIPGSMLKHNGNIVCIITMVAYLIMGVGSVVSI